MKIFMLILLMSPPLIFAQSSAESKINLDEVNVSQCEWENEIPRRIVKTPSSCNKRYPIKTCFGYVRCNMPTGKFVLSVTCNAVFCEGNQVQECMSDEKFTQTPASQRSFVSEGIQSTLGGNK